MKNQDRIKILKIDSSIGEWCISTDRETFDISHVTYGFAYHLTVSSNPEFERVTTVGLHELVCAVAEHRTRLAVWDRSTERVSDYVPDWTLCVDKKFMMKLIADYLLRYSASSSMRGMIDYFEHKHSYLMRRMDIHELLTELVVSRQIAHLPSMDMSPFEMKDLERLAKQWLDEPVG